MFVHRACLFLLSLLSIYIYITVIMSSQAGVLSQSKAPALLPCLSFPKLQQVRAFRW